MKPEVVVLRNSLWCWQHLCGEEWRLVVCPHCLAEMGRELTAMN